MSLSLENVGIKVPIKTFTENQIQLLKSKLPTKTIIRIFGFAGTGKGTLSQRIATLLDIPNLESSLILRAITMVFEDLGLSITPKSVETIAELLEFLPGEKNEITSYLQGKLIPRSQLKSPSVDAKVGFYSASPIIREKYYEILSKFLMILTKPSVLDGRGAYPPYITTAEKAGFQIIRIFLDCRDDVNAHRYYLSHINKLQATNTNYIETEAEKKQILSDFKKGILERNLLDLRTWEDQRMGVITSDSGLLDTSDLTPDQVTESALAFVWDKIHNS